MRVAIYCRLSEEDRGKQFRTDDSESIQNQKSLLLQYAMDRDWDVCDIYSDDDYRGSDRSRPEWNQLLKDAEQRKFDIVLCKTQARFTREMEMVEKYIHFLFPTWGIRFIGVADHADTENKGNKKQRQIMGLTNEWYLEDMSDSIKAALTARRKEGFHIGSFPLYGYIKCPKDKGKLIIDPEAAAVVREVFRLYVEGHGKTYIARHLNDRGIPNPTEYKRQKGITYKTPKHKLGTLWKYYAISAMLENEVYIGNMVQGRYGSISYKTGVNKPIPKDQWIRVENTHEPIIDLELWGRTQELLKSRSKPFGTGKVGLFSKKTRCVNCGYTMRACKTHGRHYLKCGTKHTAKDACVGSFISVIELEAAVLTELQQLLDCYLDNDEVGRYVRIVNTIEDKIVGLQSEKSTCIKKIAEYGLAIKQAYMDKVKGVISDTEFVDFSQEFSTDKKRLESRVQSIDDEITTIEHRRDKMKDKRQIIAEYANVERLDRVMVETLIDYVLIGKRDPETKQVPVEIYWNF